jgi:hypothetical protein
MYQAEMKKARVHKKQGHATTMVASVDKAN